MRRLVIVALLAGVVAGCVAAVAIPRERAPSERPLRHAPAHEPLEYAPRIDAVPGSVRVELRRDDPDGGPDWVVRTFSARQRFPGGPAREAGRRSASRCCARSTAGSAGSTAPVRSARPASTAGTDGRASTAGTDPLLARTPRPGRPGRTPCLQRRPGRTPCLQERPARPGERSPARRCDARGGRRSGGLRAADPDGGVGLRRARHPGDRAARRQRAAAPDAVAARHVPDLGRADCRARAARGPLRLRRGTLRVRRPRRP
jgi:hypothetical protein